MTALKFVCLCKAGHCIHRLIMLYVQYVFNNDAEFKLVVIYVKTFLFLRVKAVKVCKKCFFFHIDLIVYNKFK